MLPIKVRTEIQAMPRAHIANEEDCLIWVATSNLEFNLNSAYLLAWQHRNRVVFQNQFPIQFIHKEIMQRASEFVYCAQTISACRPRVERRIRWEKPSREWYKLNTDGSSLGNPGAVRGGGVIRDASGAWI